ncbi:MAG: TonB-dependent receptor [Prevotella sp.]|nr:TonB-dependent receptor [Candidatus Prevotella equi]
MLLLFFTLLTIDVYGQQGDSANEENLVIKVEGTELSRLPFVIDVLKQIPKVSVSDDDINVIGRGTPAIYIGNRKVMDVTELLRIAANYVSSITVMTQPGAEYEKDVQAVIVINLVKKSADGLAGDGTLRFDLSRKLASNVEATLVWKKKALQLGTHLAYNEEYKNFNKKSFKYHYKDQTLISKEENVQTPDKYRQRITGALFGSYAFSDKNLLTLQYTYTRLCKNRTYTPETSKIDRNSETRHNVGFEYSGTLRAWNLTVGNNTFFNNIEENGYSPKSFAYYLRKQSNVRSYARAKTDIGKGNLSIGAEHEYDYMEKIRYEDNYNVEDNEQVFFRTHSEQPDHTIGVFASASQQFGRWTIEGGLRYEHRSTSYQPFPDDGLMMLLDADMSVGSMLEVDKDPVAGALFTHGEMHKKRDFFFPSLKITTKQGKSQFTLHHTQSSVRPNLGYTRLATKDLGHLKDRIVVTERVVTTSLDWKYSWANLTATYTHYIDPICSTMNGSVSYNAPDYDAFDVNATLSPRIGIWSPVLNVNVHKQWFYMQLANGKDKLHDILCRVSLDNTISLPSNWLILINAKWHSKGGERNWYFFKPDFCLNASVQKEFPRQKLTLILSANNIFKSSYSDVTRYTQAYNNISEGAREEITRSVSLTAKYKF